MNEKSNVHTVLVVEDEVLIRMAISEYLRECGFAVIEAGDAEEAVTVLGSGVSVDLVFTDVQMPGAMNGFGLARWIRQHHSGIEIIITSGWAGAASEAGDLCESGPLVTKPYEHSKLLDRIKRLLAQKERKRDQGAA